MLADRYRIERVLGEGGMATVYLAYDLRHDRKVAVKVLRPELAASIGPDRFLREIRIAAKLQHPHILMLIDSGESDGFLFYVMPYVEGESLRQKLLRERELPVPEVVSILRDVVDALAYAHGQGVVHRDIKPDNILLSGRHALVADFGVAKALSQATGQSARTTAGLSLGTPIYMAPEQVAADPNIDHRADIYAVGTMAYELLSGSPPITGDTPQAVLAAQVTELPEPLDRVRPSIPIPLAQLVMRCLEKRAADRWQHAEDLLPLLAAASTPNLGVTPSSLPATAPGRRWVSRAALGAFVILLAALGASLIRPFLQPVGSLSPESLQLTFDGHVSISDDPPVSAQLSPDGQFLAYSVGSFPGFTLKVRDLVGGTVITILDSVAAVSWDWSPDGSQLGVAARVEGQLGVHLFPRLGGAAQRALWSTPYFAWSPDGGRVVGWSDVSKGGMRVLDLRFDSVQFLTTPGADEWMLGGRWAPGGDLFALITSAADDATSHLWVIDLATGSHVLAHTDTESVMSSVHWAPRGNALYFMKAGNVFRLAVDPRNGRPEGGPDLLLRLEGAATFSLSRDGSRLAYTRRTGHVNYSLVRMEDQSDRRIVLTTGTARKSCPTLSPDGEALVFVQESPEGKDLYRVSTAGGTPRRLTFDGNIVLCPAWDPSALRIAYGARVGQTTSLGIMQLAGGTPRMIHGLPLGEELQWAPGSSIMYQTTGNRNFMLFEPATGATRPLVTSDTVGWLFSARVSPDGERVAVLWNRGAPEDHQLWTFSLRDSSRVRRAQGSWWPLGWSADSRSIYARAWQDQTVKLFPSDGGVGTELQRPDVGDASCLPYEPPRGLVWLCTEDQSFSDVWMIDNAGVLMDAVH